MSKNVNFVSHKKSKQKNQDGSPKLPVASALVEGEIAINFAENVETISILNESGHVVTFSSDNYYSEKKLGSAFTGANSAVTVTDVIEENEEIIAAALADLDERKLDASAYTPSVELWEAGTGENSVILKNSNNVASGISSVAEGSGTTASGNYSHAEGSNTTASGQSSHAEGYNTKASGDYSHAEGYETSAMTDYSHAEGCSTLASGYESHAEGYGTVASGSYSHAEGKSTVASGYESHAEGDSTLASGSQSHAEGNGTSAMTDYSHAEGNWTLASGWCSHAEGEYTVASGSYSHAEGNYTLASGYRSHAEGHSTSATTNCSHAEGLNTLANGWCSHAEGDGTLASGSQSHAEGDHTSATTDYSHAEGCSTLASGYESHAEGYGTVASGFCSHAEGNKTLASGYESHAEGSSTVASGYFSHAEGQATIASKNWSHAEGYGTSAMTDSSHAEGNSTLANGYHSHAEGRSTVASGYCSHAEGDTTSAMTDYSHAEGLETIANNKYEHASGRFNISSSASTEFGDSGNTLFSVGNGDGATRHNAFEIRQNGDIYIVSGNTDIKLQDNLGGNITVDQVLDNTTSASTNPVSSKAVYDAIVDNELVWTNAYVAMSGAVSAHTANTEIHVTAADKTAWNAKVDKSWVEDKLGSGFTGVNSANTVTSVIEENEKIISSALNDLEGRKLDASAYTPVDISQYYTKSETSGKTEIANALQTKSNANHNQASNTITAMTGYVVASTSGDITTSDTLNQAIGKLEKNDNDILSALEENKGFIKVVNPDTTTEKKGLVNSLTTYYDTNIGNHAVIEGEGSENANIVASGNYSHAEGQETIASGNWSHAEGYKTSAITVYSHAEGSSTLASGVYSHAEGSSTVASGYFSHAEGSSTVASGYFSHAEGSNTLASGMYSHVEGFSTLARGGQSHAEGYETSAMTDDSHAEGRHTLANGYYSHAEGYETSAMTDDSHAEGSHTLANGYYSHAEGAETSAMTDSSHAEGSHTLASGYYSHAEGYGTSAMTDSSHAEGDKTLASGDYSHAEGEETIASGKYSHAEGEYTLTNGYCSHAEGYRTSAMTSYSHAEGSSTIASGNYSHAEGQATTARGYWSHVEGQETIANNHYEHASGRFNISSSASTEFGDSGNTLFSVGNGDNVTRHNAFEIRQNGDIYISSGGTSASTMVKLQDEISSLETMNRRTRADFTSNGLEWFKATLKSAIADKSLEKYGLKVGDYYTATHDGKTYNYVIAGLNTMRGASTLYRLDYDHVGIIVDTNDTHAWNTGGTTTASTNTHSTNGTWTSGTSAAGYASCDLQYYLETTVLPNVESDLGASNLKAHSKLYSNAVNTSGYNRFGSPEGCSSSWAGYRNQKICALSEIQVYGSIVWSSSGYDTGEACCQLDVFRVYNMNEIFEDRYPWLRDVASSSHACNASGAGSASHDAAWSTLYVAALILFA